MKTIDFKKIIKVDTPQHIIEQYITCKLSLTSKQLQQVIDLKKGTSYDGHGGVNCIYAKN